MYYLVQTARTVIQTVRKPTHGAKLTFVSSEPSKRYHNHQPYTLSGSNTIHTKCIRISEIVLQSEFQKLGPIDPTSAGMCSVLNVHDRGMI